jgi:hypothetical protein
MGTSDGTVLGPTKVVDHGPDQDKWNLVIAGDGFTSAELPAFEAVVDDFVAFLQGVSPFNGALTWDWINVHRLDVESDESGADNPGCDGTLVDTYFDAEFCVNGIDRTVVVDENIVIDEATTHVPEWDALLVFVNSTATGGTARGGVAVDSLDPSNLHFSTVHELGHAAFGLADEYDYYAGCNSGETDQDVYDLATLGEPPEPNVSASGTSPKWASRIDPATPTPTTSNPDCTQCDPLQTSPVPTDTIGAFEGARYYHCGCFRPEFTCRMRSSFDPFCAVCVSAILDSIVLSGVTGSPCFVAGAVYGDPLHPDAVTLRAWRDEHLRAGARGRRAMRALVAAYGRIGPPLARATRSRPHAARLLRTRVFVPWAAALRRRGGAS